MLIMEYPEMEFGPVPPVGTECPFCGLIWMALKLAFGETFTTEELNTTPGGPLKTFIQSKSWWSRKPLDPFESLGISRTKFRRGRERLQPRIVLAVNRNPPKTAPIMARERASDQSKNRFVIAEFEAVLLELAANCEDDPRIYRRPIKPNLDTGLIKQWLEGCEQHRHKPAFVGTEVSTPFDRGNGFRLVDVIEECLVQKNEVCDYAALSYVWGDVPSALKTTKSNVAALGKSKASSEGPLETSNHLKIPRTILDTMVLLRRIGKRYLWVDALCIVQDDAEEKKLLIHGMDRVYENASLTIIAAAGVDADAGLPGITPRTSLTFETPITVHNPGYERNRQPFQLGMCRPSLMEQLRISRWNTRAWTYQEQCLS